MAEKRHKQICVKYSSSVKIMNMAIFLNFKVIRSKLNAIEISAFGNYALKLVTVFHNC